jgi:hypothetical protein
MTRVNNPYLQVKLFGFSRQDAVFLVMGLIGGYHEGMDYTPRAESVRHLAMAAYLPFVAVFLLARAKTRDIRLIRFHAYQAIGLMIWLVLMLFLGSILSTLFGGLPGVGLTINLAVGVLFLVSLIGCTGVAVYGAVMAYQGNYTGVPVLTDWVWIQVNGSGRPVPPAKKKPARRKRRPTTDDQIAEAIVPPPPPPPPPTDWLS